MSHIVSVCTMFGPLGQGSNEERKMTRFKNEAVAFPQTQRIAGINRTHVHCVRAESTALSPFRCFFSPLVGGLVFCVRRMRRKHCLSTAGVITTRQQHITTPPIVLQPSHHFNDLSARHATCHSTTGSLLCPNARINHCFFVKIASMSCPPFCRLLMISLVF
jgi:hypothetical protein